MSSARPEHLCRKYAPTAVVPATWSRWTLWQYTDGAHGPGAKALPGVGHGDQNCYNGTADDLLAK